MSSFVFHRGNKVIQVWNDTRVKKKKQNFHFWMNYPVKSIRANAEFLNSYMPPRILDLLYSRQTWNVCRQPMIVISRRQLENSTEMKVWNEKALQTSQSRSLVLGFIFLLKESHFAVSVLYQEVSGVMRYVVSKG